ALRFTLGFWRQRNARGDAPLFAFRFQGRRDMAAFGPNGFTARLVEISDLHGIVAVALLVAHLKHATRPDLQHRHRRDFALLIVHLRHADFLSQHSQRHDCLIPRTATEFQRKAYAMHQCAGCPEQVEWHGWHALSLRRACLCQPRPSKTQGVPPGSPSYWTTRSVRSSR